MPERATQRDDLGQVVAHRGLAAGELHVAAGGDVQQAPVPPLDRARSRDPPAPRRRPPRSTPGTRGRSAASPRGARSTSAARARRRARSPSGTRGSAAGSQHDPPAPLSRHASKSGGPLQTRACGLAVLGAHAPQPDLVAPPGERAVETGQADGTERERASIPHGRPHAGRSPRDSRRSRTSA